VVVDFNLEYEMSFLAEMREARQHFFIFFTIFLSGSSRQQVPRSSISGFAAAQRFGAGPFSPFE
jgi:hypothetical protein